MKNEGQTFILSDPGDVTILKTRIFFYFLIEALKFYKNPFKAILAFKKIKQLQKEYRGTTKWEKFVVSGGKFFWSFTGPGWPSDIHRNYLQTEFKLAKPEIRSEAGLRTFYFAITTKCPLSCEHCFEWDNLNKKEPFTLEQLIEIGKKIQKKGVAQIQLSGGEPLSRFNDLLCLVNELQLKSNIWVISSGYGLTEYKALQLKEAGLTGISVSIDHWDQYKHDKFRGKSGAFEKALAAVQYAKQAGLLVCFSICATRDFISWDNLMTYADLALKYGASFINILEPKNAGRYKERDVALSPAHKDLLERFYFELNFSAQYKRYPIVEYPDYQLRKFGCLGGGNRFIYTDSLGEINKCPFCRDSYGNMLTTPLAKAKLDMEKNRCSRFKPATI